MFRVWNVLPALVALVLSAGLVMADDKDTEKKKGKGKGKRGRATPEQMFNRMDANKDGKVTKEEFTKFHEELRKKIEVKRKNRPANAGDRRFNLFDSNKDGSITLDEFKAGTEKLRERGQNLRKPRTPRTPQS